MTLSSELEFARNRLAARRESSTVDGCFPKQASFVNDETLKKVAFTPRRSGKTTGFAHEFMRDALRFPGRGQIYLGDTKQSAELGLWTGALERMLDERKIKHEYVRTKHTVQFDNGSWIYIGGMDASPREMKRLRGGKFHRAVVDECQSATQDLRHLIFGVLEPCVSDFASIGGGYLELGGTPGLQMGDHYWFQVTRPELDARARGWKVHTWNVTDNPHMSKEFAGLCEDRERDYGANYREDPNFRREWLGHWVLETGDKFYKFDEATNVLADEQLAAKLLKGRSDKTWTYVMGCDLGWEDYTAFVVAAFSKERREFFIVESERVNHTTVSVIGTILRGYYDRFNVREIYIDAGGGSGKLVAETLAIEHKIPIRAADKLEKETAVARMNSDFVGGIIKVVAEKNPELIGEWSELVVDKAAQERGVFREVQRHHNHLADAARYAHRNAQHFFGKELEKRESQELPQRMAQRPVVRGDIYDRLDAARAARAGIGHVRGWR